MKVEAQRRECAKVEREAGDCYHTPDGALACALCDHEMDWDDCTACGGDGDFDGHEEDPNFYMPGETVPCHMCAGRGGDHWCPKADCKTLTCRRVVPPPSAS